MRRSAEPEDSHGRGVGARVELHGHDPGPPLPPPPSPRSSRVFSEDRVQQVSSRSLIFPFLVEVFKVFAQDRVHLHHSHLQLVFMVLQMGLVKGVFRTFPRPKKTAKITGHSSARVPRQSSSTLSSHQMARAARPQDFTDDGNIFREDDEKVWVRLDTGQWKLLLDQSWP